MSLEALQYPLTPSAVVAGYQELFDWSNQTVIREVGGKAVKSEHWWWRFCVSSFSTRAEASLKESAEERGKGGRLAAPRVTGMYSKHRQKNAQILPTQCGRFLFILSFLLLNGVPERASGDLGEQALPRKRTVTAHWLSEGRPRRDVGDSMQLWTSSQQVLLSVFLVPRPVTQPRASYCVVCRVAQGIVGSLACG
ncbi:unnamed protein product [Arctogadus glacialis]